MINRYKKELDQIHAGREFKERLRRKLSESGRTAPAQTHRLVLSGSLSVAVLVLLVAVMIFHLSMKKPQPLSIPDLQAIPLSENEFLIGGLGGIGTPEEVDFSHTDLQAISIQAEVLPVYKNKNAVRTTETPTSLPEDKSREKLEDYALRLGIKDYTLKNEPMGMELKSSDWSVMLIYRTEAMISYTGKESQPFIGGKTKEEVLRNVRLLLEEKQNWFGLESPRIDVCADAYHPNENNWQIRVIEETGDPVENLTAYQTNYIQIFTDSDGHFSMFRIFSEDLSLKIGNYPIKTQEEALQDLSDGKAFQPLIQGDPSQVFFSEIISPRDAPVNYAIAYVPAVKNEYLIRTGNSDSGKKIPTPVNANETKKAQIQTIFTVFSDRGDSVTRRNLHSDSFRKYPATCESPTEIRSKAGNQTGRIFPHGNRKASRNSFLSLRKRTL